METSVDLRLLQTERDTSNGEVSANRGGKGLLRLGHEIKKKKKTAQASPDSGDVWIVKDVKVFLIFRSWLVVLVRYQSGTR